MALMHYIAAQPPRQALFKYPRDKGVIRNRTGKVRDPPRTLFYIGGWLVIFGLVAALFLRSQNTTGMVLVEPLLASSLVHLSYGQTVSTSDLKAHTCLDGRPVSACQESSSGLSVAVSSQVWKSLALNTRLIMQALLTQPDHPPDATPSSSSNLPSLEGVMVGEALDKCVVIGVGGSVLSARRLHEDLKAAGVMHPDLLFRVINSTSQYSARSPPDTSPVKPYATITLADADILNECLVSANDCTHCFTDLPTSPLLMNYAIQQNGPFADDGFFSEGLEHISACQSHLKLAAWINPIPIQVKAMMRRISEAYQRVSHLGWAMKHQNKHLSPPPRKSHPHLPSPGVNVSDSGEGGRKAGWGRAARARMGLLPASASANVSEQIPPKPKRQPGWALRTRAKHGMTSFDLHTITRRALLQQQSVDTATHQSSTATHGRRDQHVPHQYSLDSVTTLLAALSCRHVTLLHMDQSNVEEINFYQDMSQGNIKAIGLRARDLSLPSVEIVNLL